MLAAIVLIICSLAGLFATFIYCRRNLVKIAEKNANEPSKAKRILNYPLTILWYGFLFVFFLGVSVNNLIFD